MNLTEILFGPNIWQAAAAMELKKSKKSKMSMPLELIGRDVILSIRHQYFNGVALEDIAAENSLNIEDIEAVIDAMNL